MQISWLKAKKGKAMSKRILVVDDDEMCRSLAAMFLTKAGYQVEKLAGGQECIDYLKEQPADLILLDVMMPQLSGPETLAVLRREKLCENTPVLFLSASENLEQELAESAVQPDGFIEKPFVPSLLLEAVGQNFKLSR